MSEIKKNLSKWLYWFILAVAIILVYKFFDNFTAIGDAIGNFIDVIAPFLAGALLAYLLYIPASRIKEAFTKSKSKLLKSNYKASDEEKLQQVIEEWFERTRTQGLKIGASYISAAIFGVISKNIVKKAKPSLRDYKRCVDEIIKIVSVQLNQQNTEQNDSEADTVKEDNTNEEIINE